MKVAVLGGAGFIGRALCARLAAEGDEVTALDLPSARFEAPGVAFRPLDVLRDAVAFEDGVEALFYLPQFAARREFPERAQFLFGVNTWGAVRAGEAAWRAGARFFAYASTGNVYAPSFRPSAEDAPLRRDDPYALSKIAAEEALALFAADRLSVTALRFFGPFGPGVTRTLPAKLRERVLAGQPVYLEPRPGETGPTDGLVISFTFLDDLTACLRELARRAAEGERLPLALNVAAPEPVSIRRFTEALAACLGLTPIFELAEAPRPGDLIADVSRLQRLMEPSFTPFEEAMRRTFDRA